MYNFRWTGGAVRLVDKIEDPLTRARAWGRGEKDEYTIPFGPWAFDPQDEVDPLAAGPWVYRYGQASAGTGSKYEALATRVHADIAARLGGPIVVTLLSPWQASYTFAAEGYLDESYVVAKLGGTRALRPGELRIVNDDMRAVTELVRILLGRTEGLDSGT